MRFPGTNTRGASRSPSGRRRAPSAQVVRNAVRGGPQRTPQVDGEALGLQRERRDGPEARQLRSLARLCLRYPEYFSDETALRLQEILPEGSWKSIMLQMLEAAAEGLLLPEGEGVDALAVEARLDEDAVHRLREIAIDDTPIDPDRSVEHVLDDLIGWFEKRRRSARELETTGKLRSAAGTADDEAALLAAKQRQLDERRARIGVRSSNTSAPPKATYPGSSNS